MPEDPLDRLERKLSSHLDRIDRQAEEVDRKLAEFLEKEPPDLFEKVSTSSSNGNPFKPLDDFSERMSDVGDKMAEPLKRLNDKINRDIDKMKASSKSFQRGFNKLNFPFQMVTNPAYGVIFLKNAREHPEMNTDDLIERTYQEALGWALDVANIAWPGTAAPDAKEQVRKRVGGLVKEYTGADLFKEGA